MVAISLGFSSILHDIWIIASRKRPSTPHTRAQAPDPYPRTLERPKPLAPFWAQASAPFQPSALCTEPSHISAQRKCLSYILAHQPTYTHNVFKSRTSAYTAHHSLHESTSTYNRLHCEYLPTSSHIRAHKPTLYGTLSHLAPFPTCSHMRAHCPTCRRMWGTSKNRAGT